MSKSDTKIRVTSDAAYRGNVASPEEGESAAGPELNHNQPAQAMRDAARRDSESHHPPLDNIVRPVLTMEEAAFYLNRRQQTLRVWACHEKGPLSPVRVHGRLGWNTDDIRSLLRCHSHAR
jgi:hypothetical protein